MPKKTITQKRLKELLHYDSETGIFTWIAARKGVTVGATAGKNDRGYIRIKVDQVYYPAHHLAWLYIHGSLPRFEIDHKNRVRSDNRIGNLRDVTRSMNCTNKSSTSSTGLRGVTKLKNGSYQAQIKRDGVNQYLGSFASAQEAHAAYQNAGGVTA